MTSCARAAESGCAIFAPGLHTLRMRPIHHTRGRRAQAFRHGPVACFNQSGVQMCLNNARDGPNHEVMTFLSNRIVDEKITGGEGLRTARTQDHELCNSI